MHRPERCASLLLLLFAVIQTVASEPHNGGSRSPTNADVTPYTGCYRVILGRWWPWGYGEEAKYVTPPNSVQLSPERGTEGFEKDHLLIRVFPPAATSSTLPGRRGGSFWDVQRNHVYMTWTSGFTGVTLKLKKHDNQLVGWAHPFFDSWRLVPHIARAKAQPIPCR
jgi:hypothetical protein